MPKPASRRQKDFASRVLDWYGREGRKDLPWQAGPTPYRVWVSEIMLQQTRVNSVIPYYEKFLHRFPDVLSLANAGLDDVLHHWSGLGYYARARNLHKAAQIIRDEFDGDFPGQIEQVMDLPGVGRSTAGAILSLSSGQRHAILDGNVKRVLTRHAGVDGWPGEPSVAGLLWEIAEARTPRTRVKQYNQAMMDLGATLCIRGKVECARCPVSLDCVALQEDRVKELPASKPKKTLPVKSVAMLMLVYKDQVLLEQRPPAGIWGGLWSFPESEASGYSDTASKVFQCDSEHVHQWNVVRHTFSHFHLDITPVFIRVRQKKDLVMEAGRHVWYNVCKPDALGIAAPVSRLLKRLKSEVRGC